VGRTLADAGQRHWLGQKVAAPPVDGLTASNLCDDSDVDREQERELRQWAGALSDVADREQRAMGRAILMLLEQINLLRAELDQWPSTPEPDATGPGPAVDDEATSDAEADATPREDTTVVGLRERLRAVAHRGRN
jgi:hypothetical protein